MTLVDCGFGFHVRQVRKRSLLGCLAALWSLTRQRAGSVLVAFDRVAYKRRTLSFTDARGVRADGSKIVIESERGAFTFDVSLLDTVARATLVRHIEARILFAHSGRHCDRSERAALEAFYVFDAEAVLVRKRRVVRVLALDASWVVSRKERVYVRRRALVSTYRVNAWIDAIEVGSLEK